MSADAAPLPSEHEVIRQYADWYAQQGYQVSVEPPPRELPEFLRTPASHMIAQRDDENMVVEIKTSPPAGFETVQSLPKHWSIAPVGSFRWSMWIYPIPNGSRPFSYQRERIFWRSWIASAARAKTQLNAASSFSYCGRSLRPLPGTADQPDFLVGSAQDASHRRDHRGR